MRESKGYSSSSSSLSNTQESGENLRATQGNKKVVPLLFTSASSSLSNTCASKLPAAHHHCTTGEHRRRSHHHQADLSKKTKALPRMSINDCFQARGSQIPLSFGLATRFKYTNLGDRDQRHRAIVFNHLVGVKDKVYPEGTHIMIPWFERTTIYDVRARPHLVESTSGSRDLQMVKIGLRVLTLPVPDQLPTIYRTLGENYNDRVLPSIIHETLKAVVAQYNASQLITQREFFPQEAYSSEKVDEIRDVWVEYLLKQANEADEEIKNDGMKIA